MTYFKTALIATAAIAFTATPALAGEKMHKDHMKTKVHAAAAHNMVANLSDSERMAWEMKVKAKMSDEKKAKWATYSEADQNAWMDKKIMKMMKYESMKTQEIGSATITTASTTYQGPESMKESMKVNDTIGEVLQADGDADPQADRKLLMASGKQMKKSTLIMKEGDNNAANNAIVVPTIGSDVLTTVSCPVGTTAQADMTCLVTGDYQPTS